MRLIDVQGLIGAKRGHKVHKKRAPDREPFEFVVENLASLFQGWHHKDAGHAAEGIPLFGRVPLLVHVQRDSAVGVPEEFVSAGAKIDHITPL